MLALALALPVYLTLLHTHEPEVLHHKSGIAIDVHTVHSDHRDHESDFDHSDDEDKHSPHDCVVCLIVSSGGLANGVSIDIPPVDLSESETKYFDDYNSSIPLYTRYFLRRGPPAPVVL